MAAVFIQKKLNHELRSILSLPISCRDSTKNLCFTIEKGIISEDINSQIRAIGYDYSRNEPLNSHRKLKNFCIVFGFNFNLVETLRLEDRNRIDIFLDRIKEYCFYYSRRERKHLCNDKVITKDIEPFEQAIHVIPRLLKDNKGIILFVRSKTESKKYVLGDRDFLVTRTIYAMVDALKHFCTRADISIEILLVPFLVKSKIKLQTVLDVFQLNDYRTIA